MEIAVPAPRWMRELHRWMGLRTQICLYGSINDAVHYPVGPTKDDWALGSLTDAVVDYLSAREVPHEIIGIFDTVDGMVFADAREGSSMADLYATAMANTAGPPLPDGSQVPGPARPEDRVELAVQQMRTCLANRTLSCAFIVNNASQLCSNPASLQPAERNSFLRLLKASHESQRVLVEHGGTRGLVQNLMILLCNKLSDLPPWLYLGNPFFTSVEVGLPRSHERRHFLQTYVMGAEGDSEGMDRVDPAELVDLTEGMTFRDLCGIRSISRSLAPAEVNAKSLVDYYKYGQRESLWDSLDWNRLPSAEQSLGQRVMGQPAAVQAVADVLRRARLHLSGAQHSSRTKPRGVLFFAGPTGVGKTEMAKSVAELVFGTEEACIRFDMSEFSQAHSDQRLLGAPPGYVGYEEGGQLTNQVKASPFSVILFDEVEKAHPSILDKFLQILEDGRMTDGRGETVHFSECIIIFTSNIGVFQLDPSTGRPLVSPHDGRPIPVVDPTTNPSYAEVQSKVLDGVRSYFKYVLSRPELLNRIGQNIVVFDFIRPDVMKQILERKVLPSIQTQVREKWRLDVRFSEAVVDELLARVSQDPSAGGRGIGNYVEVAVLNPLARVLYKMCSDGADLEGRCLTVTGIETAADAPNGCQGIGYEFV